MKVSEIFLLCIVVSQVICCSKKSEKTIALAINGVLNGFFLKNSIKVDLIVYGTFKKSEGIVEKLLTVKNDSIPMRILNGNFYSKWRNKLNTSSILLFDSPQTFKQHYNNITWKNEKGNRQYHLVYYPNAKTSEYAEINDGFSIDFVDFLMCAENQPPLLVISYMFTPIKCRSLQFFGLNKFLVSSNKWTKSFFYPEKYLNFFGCRLQAITRGSDGGSSLATRKILEAFANSTDAKISFNGVPSKAEINPKHFDFYSSAVTLSVKNNNGTLISYPYFIDYWIFFIPPGDLYTQLEKMFLPFQEELWVAVVVTLMLGIVISKLIELTSERVRDFVFGNNITHPTVNFVATFLTGVQPKLPRRNFARFCLILVISWSLVIRTCYQSELFKHLQSDKRKTEVKTMAEMIKKNFTFYDDGYLIPMINEIAEKNSLKK